MSEALVQQGEQGLGFDNVKLKPARIELVQGMKASELNVAPGSFRDVEASSLMPSKIQVVPLKIQPTRVYWPKGSGLKAKPICRSNDTITPVDGPDLIKQASLCEKCRHADWKAFRTTGEKPLCQERWRFLFIDADTSLPYIMTVGGMSIKSLRNFRDSIFKLYHIAKQDKVVDGKVVAGVRLNIFDFTAEMTPAKKTSGKGHSYYELQFNNVGKIKHDDERFMNLFNMYVNRQQEEAEEEVPEETGSSDASDI